MAELAEKPVEPVQGSASGGAAVNARGPTEPDSAALTRRRKERTRPPRRQGASTRWLTLLGLLAVALPAVLLDLGTVPVVHPREARQLAQSAETWRYLASVGDDGGSWPLVAPRYGGQEQYVGPPGATWLQLAAFNVLGVSGESDEAALSDMVFAGRLVSVLATLAMLAAVFWAGHSIGGMQPAFAATAVAMATPVLIWSGRLATADAPRLALMMLAMAGALWAIRPLRPAASVVRQAVGWLICGVALGIATLTAGPLAVAWVLYPVLLILLLCPHRLSHGLGMVAAAIIAILCVTPWAVHVHEHYPQVWGVWTQRLLPTAGVTIGQWWVMVRESALLLAAATMPWSLWILAAMVQPFSTSSAGSRGRMFIGWGWFLVIGLLVLLTPDTDELSGVLVTMPVAAVLLGQLFRQYADLSAEGRHARLWRAMRWPQMGLFFAASLAIPLGLGFQEQLAAAGFLPHPMVKPLHMGYWLLMATALLVVVAISLRYAVREYPGWTLGAWAGWVVLAMIMLVGPLSRGPLLNRPAVLEARMLARLASDRSVYIAQTEPDPLLVLHAFRRLVPVTLDQLEAVKSAGQPLLLLSPRSVDPGRSMAPVDDLPALGLMLWRFVPEAAGASAGTMPATLDSPPPGSP